MAVLSAQPLSNTQDSIDLLQERNAAAVLSPSHFSGVTVAGGLVLPGALALLTKLEIPTTMSCRNCC